MPILFALLICLTSSFSMAGTVNIAVAANFKPALLLLEKSFQQQYPGHQLSISSASTAMLFNQISHGAPFDVLLAADEKHPSLLAQKGLGLASNHFTYAHGQLVIAASHHNRHHATASSTSKIGEQLKLARHIAIANPALAPYGLAAQQSLQHLGLWDQLQSQLIRGNSISQAQQFLMTGNADWAFVPLSPLLNQRGIAYWMIPPSWYQPIRQQAILLQSAQHNDAAIAFMDFLQSKSARHLIQQQGYLLPSRK